MRARRGRVRAAWAARGGADGADAAAAGVSLARIAAAGVGAGVAARTGAGAGAEADADASGRAAAGWAGTRGGRTAEGGKDADGAAEAEVAAAPVGVYTVVSVAAEPAFAPANWPRNDATSRVSVSTVASRRATRSAKSAGGWAGGACIANAPGGRAVVLALALLQRIVEAEPDRGTEHCAGDAGEIPDQCGNPAYDEADCGKSPVHLALLPLSRIVIGLRSDVCRSRRYRHGRQANRHALLTTVAAWRPALRSACWRGMYHSGPHGFSGLARYRGMLRTVSPRGFLHGHAFYRWRRCAFV